MNLTLWNLSPLKIPMSCLGYGPLFTAMTHPHLVLLLSQPLKHVGIELLFPGKLPAGPLLAHSQLGLGGFVAGIELQDLLEVSSCQVKVIHGQVCLSPAEQALLVVAVQLQGLRAQRENSRDIRLCSTSWIPKGPLSRMRLSGNCWCRVRGKKDWGIKWEGSWLRKKLI